MKNWQKTVKRWLGFLVLIAVAAAYGPLMGALAVEEVVNATYLDITQKDSMGHYLRIPTLAHHITPAAGAGETTFITEEWYIVDQDLTIPDRLEVYGNSVNIIVANGATLTVKNGISIRGDAPNGKWTKLTIWAQSDATQAGSNAGKIIATSSFANEKGGAGIGASYGSSRSDRDTPAGELIINGGNIYAEGGKQSAGIGGSSYRGMRAITINGGRVDARGSTSTKDGGGAGIGGGYQSQAFPITITGGVIEAHGGPGGAGIGNGNNYSGKNDNPSVTCHITGSANVTAVGGKCGAGIGGGSVSCYGGILINGDAVVTATGVYGGAGIGGGNERGNMGIIIGGNARVWAYSRNRYAEPQHAYSWSEEANDWLARTENGKIVAEKTADNGNPEELIGAAIGGGNKAAGYDVTIRDNAQVCAWSGGWGAGIGGGGQEGGFAEGRTITIEGNPKVLAFGGAEAAGIGAGFAGNQLGQIIITGGDVTAYGGFDIRYDQETSKAGAPGIGGGRESLYSHGGEGGPVIITGGRVRAMAGSMYTCAIGKGYNDRVEGTITLGDRMWVRWSNDVGKYFDHEDQYTDNSRPNGVSYYGWDGNAYYREPSGSHAPWLDFRNVPRLVNQASLQPSKVDNRVYDIHHSRYVIIEKCPHELTCYTDVSPTEHRVKYNCEYCKIYERNVNEPHSFDPVTHTCVCGHREHQAKFYAEENPSAQTAPYYASPYTSDGLKYQKPAQDPTKDGYTFGGWYERDANGNLKAEAYNFNQPVTADVSLCAKWIKNETIPTTKYDVKFYLENQSTSSQTVVSVEAGKYVPANEIPQPAAQEGMVFEGWFEKNGETFFDHPFDFTQPITKSVNLYPKWTVKKPTYTVTFHPENGDDSIVRTVEKGDLVLPPDDPEKTGWIFSYWVEKDGPVEFANPFVFTTPIEKNYDLYAHYDLPVHGVYFDPDGGVFPDDAFATRGWNRIYVRQGETVDKPLDPVREGWDFVGWEHDGEAYDFSSPVTGNITLVAHWVMHGVDFDSIVAPIPEEGLVYDGTEQPLLKVPGRITGGRMYYALTIEGNHPAYMSEEIPTAINAGTYYVWYIVPSDGIHEQRYERFKVTIAPRPLTITAKDQYIEPGAEIETGVEQVTVQGLVRNEKAGWEYILKEIHLEVGSGKNEGKILPGDAVLAVLSFSEKGGLRVETAAEGTDNYTITYIPGRLIILPGPAEVPKTGDPSFPLAWLMTVLLGAAGIAGLLARKKK